MKKLLIVAFLSAAIFSCKKEDAKIFSAREVQHIIVDFGEVLSDTTALGKVVFNFENGERTQAIVKNTKAYFPIQTGSPDKRVSSIIVERLNINTFNKHLYLIDEQLTLKPGMKPVKINVTSASAV